MESSELRELLLKLLLDFEEDGEIVITNPNPAILANQMTSNIIEKWGHEFEIAPPFEVVIEDCIGSSSRYIEQNFGVSEQESRLATEKFIKYLSDTRSLSEVSDLLCHQGYQDIALGAYYSFHLNLGKYYSPAFLEWRKDIYAKQKIK